MADQPPTGPASTPLPPPAGTPLPAPVSTPLPPPAKSGRSCFGCGCGGCLLAIVLVVLLVVGGGYYFFIVQAQAAVPAPAALQVISTPVDVDTNNSAGFHTARPGQELTAGNIVRTGIQGHATIQFPDGSFVRMSPTTTVTVTAAQLSHDGNLQSASLSQKAGRTFTNVQHLVSGASFQVGGHSVSASVRGTQFEILVRIDNTNLIKVFEGTVKVQGTSLATLTAGQQIDADANGRLSGQGLIKPEAADPFFLEAQCARTVSAGNNLGTVQTSTGEGLATGQTAEADYSSPGGTLSIALCYPGSLMTLTIIDPAGVAHTSKQSSRPLQANLSGPPGRYRAIVRAEDVPGGEAWAVSFATNSSCSAEPVDTGGFVRQTLSNDQLSQALASSGVTLQVQGTSPASARVSYYSDLGGVPIAWTVIFYAATPNLGVVLTQVTVRGINLTTQVASRLSSVIGQSLSVPTDFTVDRVYSCKGAGGAVMVIEGHRAA
jgi:FecR protein